MGEQVDDCSLERREFDWLRFEPLPSSKSEQPPDQLATLLGGTLGHAEHTLLFVGQLDTLLE
jgi:hypothetical protein